MEKTHGIFSVRAVVAVYLERSPVLACISERIEKHLHGADLSASHSFGQSWNFHFDIPRVIWFGCYKAENVVPAVFVLVERSDCYLSARLIACLAACGLALLIYGCLHDLAVSDVESGVMLLVEQDITPEQAHSLLIRDRLEAVFDECGSHVPRVCRTLQRKACRTIGRYDQRRAVVVRSPSVYLVIAVGIVSGDADRPLDRILNNAHLLHSPFSNSSA